MRDVNGGRGWAGRDVHGWADRASVVGWLTGAEGTAASCFLPLLTRTRGQLPARAACCKSTHPVHPAFLPSLQRPRTTAWLGSTSWQRSSASAWPAGSSGTSTRRDVLGSCCLLCMYMYACGPWLAWSGLRESFASKLPASCQTSCCRSSSSGRRCCEHANGGRPANQADNRDALHGSNRVNAWHSALPPLLIFGLLLTSSGVKHVSQGGWQRSMQAGNSRLAPLGLGTDMHRLPS